MPAATKPNPKSDVAAKKAYVQHLLDSGYESAVITKAPADITAKRDGAVFYFEVKFTNQTNSYFGAATLTEWEAALANESHYWFVVASKRDDAWNFQKYTPGEFMEFSTIPPFKVYFNLEVGADRDTRKRGKTSSIRLTRERILLLSKLLQQFRAESQIQKSTDESA